MAVEVALLSSSSASSQKPKGEDPSLQLKSSNRSGLAKSNTSYNNCLDIQSTALEKTWSIHRRYWRVTGVRSQESRVEDLTCRQNNMVTSHISAFPDLFILHTHDYHYHYLYLSHQACQSTSPWPPPSSPHSLPYQRHLPTQMHSLPALERGHNARFNCRHLPKMRIVPLMGWERQQVVLLPSWRVWVLWPRWHLRILLLSLLSMKVCFLDVVIKMLCNSLPLLFVSHATSHP